MKLKVEKQELNVAIGDFDEKEFSIDSNSDMIIKLLRDKMYKNKIAAVCREVASNSRDANRENGKSNEPIIIELIKEDSILLGESYSIAFSDRGIGINPERMDNIFLKYGNSTKRDTDKYTGGFGIGAKTPFAYTNEFLIDTVSEIDGENILHQYQAVISSDGIKESSKMILINTEKTNEQTGTKITIPISAEDVNKFTKELSYVTCFWKTMPTFIGFEFGKNTIKKIYEEEEFIFIEDSKLLFGDSKYILLIDEIPYVLNNDMVRNINEETGSTFILIERQNATKRKFVFKFNTGELSVSGSREEIELTKENVKNLVKRNTLLQNRVNELITDSIQNAESYFMSCRNASDILRNKATNKYVNVKSSEKLSSLNIFLNEVFNSLNYSDLSNSKIEELLVYKGENVQIFIRDFLKYEFIEISPKGVTATFRRVKRISESLNCSIWDRPMYVVDVSNLTPLQNLTLKERHESGYILIYDENSNVFPVEKMDELKKLGFEVSTYSSVEKSKKEVVITKKTNKDEINIVGRIYDFNKNDWEKYNASFNVKSDSKIKKTVYILTSSLNFLDRTNYSSTKILGLDKEEQLLSHILNIFGYEVIAITESKIQKAEIMGINHIEKEFKKLLNKEQKEYDLIVNAVQYSDIISLNLGEEENVNLLKVLNFEKKYKDAFNVLVEALEKSYERCEKNSEFLKIYNKIEKLSSVDFKEKYDLFSKEKKEFDLFVEFIENNPLIKMLMKIKDRAMHLNTRMNEEEEVVFFERLNQQVISLFSK